MGTSGAYGGSGGPAWSRARRRARNLPGDPTQQDIDRVLEAVGDALSEPPGETQGGEAEPQPTPSAEPMVSWGPISARPIARSGADGPAGGGGRGGGAGGRGRDGGSRRSTAAVARVGTRTARAGAALFTGDARALEALGISLADLTGLGPEEQAQRLASAIVVGDSIENAEMRVAADALLLAQIRADHVLTPAEVGRIYATAWASEVLITELAAAYQQGRPREQIQRINGLVQDSIRAIVSGLIRDDMQTMDVEAVITEVVDRARSVMAAAGRHA